MPTHNIYKQLGQTPLQALTQFKTEHGLKGSVTYAGRLDPMAEGVLLLLSGKTIQEKEKYLKLAKTYRAVILFGFETDTHDLLGLAKRGSGRSVTKTELAQKLTGLTGSVELPVPAFSSVPVAGKPLFFWARAGKKIQPVLRDMQIHAARMGSVTKISKQELAKVLSKNIGRVTGDFRQQKILLRWEQVLQKTSENSFFIGTVEIECGSGTYVRAIAHELGRRLKTGAVLFNLKRMNIGKFSVKKSIRLHKNPVL